jgi:serine/threonine-protein kinase RsbW
LKTQNQKAIFPGKFASLSEIGKFIRQICSSAGFDNKQSYKIESSVDEACSNIIEHGYGQEGIGTITIRCINQDEKLTIIIEDDAPKFDPRNIPAPNLDLPLEDRNPHGLGLHFIRQWMDDVEYEALEKQGNRLILIKIKEKSIK